MKDIKIFLMDLLTHTKRKEEKGQHVREHYKNFSEDEKQKLAEDRK